jgi:pilus assembly protein Flp/PilA
MLWLIESLMGEVGTDFIEYVVQVLADSSGATAIEYGLIAALIAIAAVGAMSGLGSQISKTFNNASTTMSQG